MTNFPGNILNTPTVLCRFQKYSPVCADRDWSVCLLVFSTRSLAVVGYSVLNFQHFTYFIKEMSKLVILG